jgi:hypothetical protein
LIGHGPKVERIFRIRGLGQDSVDQAGAEKNSAPIKNPSSGVCLFRVLNLLVVAGLVTGKSFTLFEREM